MLVTSTCCFCDGNANVASSFSLDSTHWVESTHWVAFEPESFWRGNPANSPVLHGYGSNLNRCHFIQLHLHLFTYLSINHTACVIHKNLCKLIKFQLINPFPSTLPPLSLHHRALRIVSQWNLQNQRPKTRHMS